MNLNCIHLFKLKEEVIILKQKYLGFILQIFINCKQLAIYMDSLSAPLIGPRPARLNISTSIRLRYKFDHSPRFASSIQLIIGIVISLHFYASFSIITVVYI